MIVDSRRVLRGGVRSAIVSACPAIYESVGICFFWEWAFRLGWALQPSGTLALLSLALLGFQCLVCNSRFFPLCVASDCTPLATLLPFPKSIGF
jgi:hypothetical protein